MADAYLCSLPGETRAAVLEGSRLVQMHVTRDGDGLTAGARVEARWKTRLGARGIAVAGAEELLVEPWPAGAREGAPAALEIVRAAWREPGRDRLAKARPTTLAPSPAPDLEERLISAGHGLRSGWPADVAQAWDDGFEAAELGRIRFEGGALEFSPTAAFTAVDVDGQGTALAVPALQALAGAIRLWGLGGGIVIDLPAAARAERTLAAQAFDSAMGNLAFERTAINGFGLLQIIRPRPGPSILERARLDRAGSAAIALLDQARRDCGAGPMRLVAASATIRWIEARPHLVQALARATGRRLDLRTDMGAGTGHVEPAL